MRAAVMRNWSLRVDDIPEPVAGAGQALAQVLACGICGSDLHLLVHGEESRRLTAEMNGDSSADSPPDPTRPVMFEPNADMVMGHEYCCEILDVGPGVSNLVPGDIVVSFPVTFDEQGVHGVGFSNKYPGGYAERIVVNEMMSIKVPNELSPDLAAMTEPLAVGVHAVEKSRIAQGDAALILGLGPVGLACIAELKMRGIGPIIGADFSPRRRALAEHLGADVVVDPRETPAIQAWRKADGSKPLVIFEAVGNPGMIEQAMRMAPKDSRILVVGACMQEDRIHPMLGIGKELSLQFVLGYSPTEFGHALTSIAEGKVNLEPLITGRVGIDGVPRAFEDLGNPEAHAKILVKPSLT
jgi:threonine dehydrogenase-like Zn-dependent dehydrogenase